MPPKVRLSPKDRRRMATVFQRLLGGRPGARVLLYGSRADPAARGGDIDLLVLVPGISAQEALKLEIALAVALKDAPGDQRIDLLVTPALTGAEAGAFVRLVAPEAVPLWP